MPVPLFDTRTPLAPLMPQLTAKAVEVLERGSYILGPEVEAFEREFADHLGARHAIGVANGTDALTIALRALGVGPGDEVVVPSFTFYASAEAIPPTGARAGVLRRRSRDVLRDGRDGARRADAAHEGGHRRRPVRQRRAGRGDRGARRARARGRGPGRRLAHRGRSPRRRARRVAGDLLVLPLEEPRRLRRRRRGRDRRRRARRSGPHAALPRLARQGDASSRSATTRASTSSRPRCCGVQLPHLEAWAEGRRAAGALYEAGGLGELVALPRARRRLPARLASLRRPPPARRRARGGPARRGHRPQGLLPRSRPTASRRCASTPTACGCRPPTSSPARTSRSR